MALTSGKIIQNYFEKVVDTYEHQMSMLDLVSRDDPAPGTLQNAGDVTWKNTQQHAVSQTGFDMTGKETGVIQETVPCRLGDPENDIWKLNVADLRDMNFWDKRGEQSGKFQATILNKAIASTIINTSSLFYRTNATSGFDALSEADVILSERQKYEEYDKYFMLNPRDMNKFAQDLAKRETINARPEVAWKTGQVASQVSGFDVFRGSFLKNITGGADPGELLTADVEGKPEGGSVDNDLNTVTNVDYRIGKAVMADTGPYAVGDRFNFTNDPGGTPTTVKAIGNADKTVTDTPMTYIITKIIDGNNIEFYPKNISLGDGALSVLELGSANVNTQPLSGAAVTRINTDASKIPSIFWCKPSIEVVGGDAPLSLLADFAGMKVISTTMKNGQKMYMAYDGNILTLDFTCRIFTWYGITNLDPSANGTMVTFT